MRRQALFLVLLSTAACNMALRNALSRAEAAHGRGDHFGEAVALKDACAAAPDEVEVCTAAKQAADEVIARQLKMADGPCQSEPNACVAALESLSALATAEDVRLTPYYDRAGALFADGCMRVALSSPEDAVFRVRCAEAYRSRVPTPGYASRIASMRQSAGTFMAELASSKAATPGVAWLHASLAACLGGQAAFGPRANALRQAFDDAHAVRLTVSGRMPLAPEALCTEVRGQVRGLLRCDGRAATSLPMAIDGWLDPLADAPVHQVRSVDVLDHTERWENPDYHFAQSLVRSARDRHRDAQNQERLADAECSSAQSALSRARSCYNCPERTREEQACNRRKAMDDIERRTRRELSDAESRLSKTPAYLTRDVYRAVNYRTVEHHFRVGWHVRIGLAGARPEERNGVLTWDSVEQEGVPAANIAYRPYTPPTPAQQTEGLIGALVEHATASVRNHLNAAASARRANCPAPVEWSECQVEAALLSGQNPAEQYAKDIGDRLDSRTPEPWPQASCAGQ